MIEGAHLPNRSPPQENHVIPPTPQHREDHISPWANEERTRDASAHGHQCSDSIMQLCLGQLSFHKEGSWCAGASWDWGGGPQTLTCCNCPPNIIDLYCPFYLEDSIIINYLKARKASRNFTPRSFPILFLSWLLNLSNGWVQCCPLPHFL